VHALAASIELHALADGATRFRSERMHDAMWTRNAEAGWTQRSIGSSGSWPDVAARDIGFRRKQGIAVALSLLAAVVVAGVGCNSQAWFGGLVPPADDLATRLAFAVHWLLAPGCMLLAGIVATARRGFYPDAIDGTRTPANRGLEIGLRYNQNTLEQMVLAVIAWLSLAVRAPHAGLAYVARGEARPAYQRAFSAQLAINA
jgi:hypothetical protein